jgi:hypothetical protein
LKNLWLQFFLWGRLDIDQDSLPEEHIFSHITRVPESKDDIKVFSWAPSEELRVALALFAIF